MIKVYKISNTNGWSKRLQFRKILINVTLLRNYNVAVHRSKIKHKKRLRVNWIKYTRQELIVSFDCNNSQKLSNNIMVFGLRILNNA